MQNNLVETLIGAAVIAVALIFLTFAYRGSDAGAVGRDTYQLSARVTNLTGVTVGTDVRIAGIKVGTVSELQLDPVTYEAIMTLSINSQYELAEDTALTVASESLLGGSFIALQPGGDFENPLKDGDEILFASGTVDLFSLIQQAIFGTGGSTSSDSGTSGSTTTPAPAGQNAPADPLGGL